MYQPFYLAPQQLNQPIFNPQLGSAQTYVPQFGLIPHPQMAVMMTHQNQHNNDAAMKKQRPKKPRRGGELARTKRINRELRNKINDLKRSSYKRDYHRHDRAPGGRTYYNNGKRSKSPRSRRSHSPRIRSKTPSRESRDSKSHRHHHEKRNKRDDSKDDKQRKNNTWNELKTEKRETRKSKDTSTSKRPKQNETDSNSSITSSEISKDNDSPKNNKHQDLTSKEIEDIYNDVDHFESAEPETPAPVDKEKEKEKDSLEVNKESRTYGKIKRGGTARRRTSNLEDLMV